MALGVGVSSKGRSASSASLATTGVATQASGSLIVTGAIWSSGSTFSSIADNKGNSANYVQISTELSWAFSNGARARMYYCPNAAGGAGHTVTWGLSGATTITAFMVEITGAALASPLDLANRQTDNSSPFVSPSIVTTNAADILISMFGGDSGSNPATHAESTGFTIQTNANETDGSSFWTGCLATRIVAATGTYNSSFTESGGGFTNVWIAAFKEAAGGGPTVYNRKPFGTPIFQSRVIQ